ncbi:MAG: c-type cytochrome [Xanthomonadales bacterium]|nr:c-type cytochrome [Xanthomonadales bacterium]MBK7146280.1 c-type cytochrome [Xanthomonadales bacterium]
MRTLLRFLIRLAALCVVLAVFVFGLAWFRSEQARNRHYALPRLAIEATVTPERIARGEHLARTRGCTGCHGPELMGEHMIDAGPVMQVYTPNLTPGGVLATHDLARFEHALRHAVARDGRPLLVMPAEDFALLSNEDVVALFVYLKQLPPVTTTQPASRIGPLGRVLYLFGQLPVWKAGSIDHALASRGAPAPPATADVAYGAYVAQGCIGCHGATLVGGRIPGTPPDFIAAANLTPHANGLADWSEADFFRAIREGKRPNGSAIDAVMPWRELRHMDDIELSALWAYLRSLPPRAR